MTVPAMLHSTNTTASAPAITAFRGSITHPTQQLCTLRGRRCLRLTQHSPPGDSLPLSWAGLPPADRASLPGAFRIPPFRHHGRRGTAHTPAAIAPYVSSQIEIADRDRV